MRRAARRVEGAIALAMLALPVHAAPEQGVIFLPFIFLSLTAETPGGRPAAEESFYVDRDGFFQHVRSATDGTLHEMRTGRAAEFRPGWDCIDALRVDRPPAVKADNDVPQLSVEMVPAKYFIAALDAQGQWGEWQGDQTGLPAPAARLREAMQTISGGADKAVSMRRGLRAHRMDTAAIAPDVRDIFVHHPKLPAKAAEALNSPFRIIAVCDEHPLRELGSAAPAGEAIAHVAYGGQAFQLRTYRVPAEERETSE